MQTLRLTRMRLRGNDFIGAVPLNVVWRILLKLQVGRALKRDLKDLTFSDPISKKS